VFNHHREDKEDKEWRDKEAGKVGKGKEETETGDGI